MKPLFLFLLLSFCLSSLLAQTVPSKEVQIKSALLAAPDEIKGDATVMGYDPEGNFTVLREGKNEMICIADDPDGKGLSVACYQKDLEPFMARGRALKKEGKSFQEIFDIREEEAKNGRLKMPKGGATLFILTADEQDYDPSNGDAKDTYLRYVVYLPWATSETTGLPLKPYAPGMPWIMDPGTHRAHIMISPPRD